MAALERDGHAAYTTSAGWLGYADDKIRDLARAAVADGWGAIKMKVGGALADDMRRAALLREILGPDRLLMTDANQVWEVDQAIEWVRALEACRSLLDRGAGQPGRHPGPRPRPRRRRAGARRHRRARATTGSCSSSSCRPSAIDVVQLDACRLGGVNEVLAVLLLAAAFDKPVCPHAGGVGLCEYVQHLSFFDARLRARRATRAG